MSGRLCLFHLLECTFIYPLPLSTLLVFCFVFHEQRSSVGARIQLVCVGTLLQACTCTVCTHVYACNFHNMAGNLRGVLIFVIFVVDSAVTKISPYEN